MISDEMNLALTGVFLESEVSLALKPMAPLKASGPNEMPPLFYQHFWEVVDHDVTNYVLSWLNSGTLPHPINHTIVTLIPKTIILSMYKNINLLVYVMCLTIFFLKFWLIGWRRFCHPLSLNINLLLLKIGLSLITSLLPLRHCIVS